MKRFDFRPTLIRSGALLLASTMLCASGAAYAQEADDAGDDDIVVTAQKRAENLQDVPLAITAIGTEKLDQLQVNEFADYVKFLPSVTIQQGAPGFAQVYFRGVASGENANHSASLPTVGTYLDEMPITTIQGALDVHAYDLARVEALAGPQGTLYGASSMAGTLKLVTNRPDTGGTYGEVGLELNSVTNGDMGGVLEGFINTPLSEKVALRAVGWYRHDAGYIDNIPGTRTFPSSGVTITNGQFVEEDYNEVDTFGGRIALGIELNDDWTVRPTLMAQKQLADGSFSRQRSGAVTGSLQTVKYNPEGGYDQWLQAAMTIEGKIGSWDLTMTGGHLRRRAEYNQDYADYSYFYDALYGSGAYIYDNTGAVINPSQRIEGGDKYRRNFAELRVASPQDARVRFIGGLFYQKQKHGIEQHYIIDNLQDSIQVPGTVDNIWLTKQTRVDRDYAAFGEASFDITDKLTLTAGGRYFKYDNSLVGFFGFNNPGFSSNPAYACQGPAIVDGSPCTNVNKRTKDTDFIHKVNLTFKPNNDLLFYATASRGFRPGGINRRGSLPPYAADQLDNYELGWKTNFGAFRFNGSVYQLDWADIQLSFIGANGLTEIRNAGNARIRGIELDLGYRTGGFSLNGGLSYNDAEIRNDFCQYANPQFDCTIPGPDDRDADLLPETNSVLAPTGTRLPVTPKLKASAVARYEFPVGAKDGHVQFAVSHSGARRSDLRTTENGVLGTLDAYTTLDFSIGIEGESWRASLFATNLLDERGVISTGTQCQAVVCGDPDGISGTGGVFYDNVIRPRLIGVKVSKEF